MNINDVRYAPLNDNVPYNNQPVTSVLHHQSKTIAQDRIALRINCTTLCNTNAYRNLAETLAFCVLTQRGHGVITVIFVYVWDIFKMSW